MEPKKLKKLTLKKEVVAELRHDQMNKLRGGGEGSYSPLAYICELDNIMERTLSKGNYETQCPGRNCDTYGGGPITGHTAPPRCCEYGCCETIGC